MANLEWLEKVLTPLFCPGLSLKGVYASGYTVLAATLVSSIYLAMI